jgi:nucleoside-diphosphate-sugar epimerase
MRIFVTGAPGFIGSALVPQLMQAGHQLLGLTRSEAGAQAMRAAGADVKYGNLEDLDSLRKGCLALRSAVETTMNRELASSLSTGRRGELAFDPAVDAGVEDIKGECAA